MNALFVVADFVAARYLVRVYRSGDMDTFILLMFSAFLSYSWGIRLVSREKEFAEYEKKLEARIPNLFFWMRLSRVAALMYLPVAVFVLYVAAEARGTIVFFNGFLRF